jgi:hypothetical protein
MRRRLSAMLLTIIGLGVPILVALMTRRPNDDGTAASRVAAQSPVAGPDPEADLLSGPQAPAGPPAVTRQPGAGQPGGADPRHPVLEPHPTGVFAAIGRFDYRFRRILPVLGLALVIGLNVWAARGGGTLIQGGWFIPGSQEQQEASLIADRFGQQPTSSRIPSQAA